MGHPGQAVLRTRVVFPGLAAALPAGQPRLGVGRRQRGRQARPPLAQLAQASAVLGHPPDVLVNVLQRRCRRSRSRRGHHCVHQIAAAVLERQAQRLAPFLAVRQQQHCGQGVKVWVVWWRELDGRGDGE